MRCSPLVFGLAVLAAAGCSHQPLPRGAGHARLRPAAVDASRLVAADQDTADWMTYGRTYDQQRFSPLEQIDVGNVARLSLAWHYDLPVVRHSPVARHSPAAGHSPVVGHSPVAGHLPTAGHLPRAGHLPADGHLPVLGRAEESTPLVIDGVLYVTGSWGTVFALDARSGKLLWSFDPKVPRASGRSACCRAANRGVAAWKGKLYLGTRDGRLVALDAVTGKPVWTVRVTPAGSGETLTGPPLVIQGRVLLGEGAGRAGLRGNVSAYDAATGALDWRFYTVPGNPDKPDGAASDAPLESIARPTWTRAARRHAGGGGVCSALAYDPKLDLLYVGTGGNAATRTGADAATRAGDAAASRTGGAAEDLFTSSILALRPETGQYVWYRQMARGRSAAHGCASPMILTDLVIDGKPRHTIIEASGNGVEVIDRVTGKLISARSLSEGPESVRARDWAPMSFSPLTRLVYVPMSAQAARATDTRSDAGQAPIGRSDADHAAADHAAADHAAAQRAAAQRAAAQLVAWDPVARKQIWSAAAAAPSNGGVLSTAGNLVFEGSSSGELDADRATDGTRLWSTEVSTGILAPPITYEVGGTQYVVVEVGWNGTRGRTGVPRVLAFSLTGKDALLRPAPSAQAPQPPRPPQSPPSPQPAQSPQAPQSPNGGTVRPSGPTSSSQATRPPPMPDTPERTRGPLD